MSNVIRFPGSQPQQETPQRVSPERMLAQMFFSGMTPDVILDRIGGAPAQQARRIISGKSPDQLRQIAINMAAQRGVNLADIAAQMGIKLHG